MAFPAKYPQLNDTELTEEARSVLIRVIRVAFPHPSFPDAPYERTADTILAEAQNSTWFRVAVTQGLLTLSHLAGGDFRDLDQDAATSVLRRIEATEFFGFVRRTTVLNLYDNVDAWDALGYEGPSFDNGGYIDRGFDDLDWLPDPRIDSYDGPESLVEIAANVPLSTPGGGIPIAAATATAHDQSARRDTSNQPGQRDTEIAQVQK